MIQVQRKRQQRHLIGVVPLQLSRALQTLKREPIALQGEGLKACSQVLESHRRLFQIDVASLLYVFWQLRGLVEVERLIVASTFTKL